MCKESVDSLHSKKTKINAELEKTKTRDPPELKGQSHQSGKNITISTNKKGKERCTRTRQSHEEV